MSIAFISHPDCSLHDVGTHHPECPSRISAINDRLIASGLDMSVRHHDAPLVTRAQLEAAHDAEYLDSLDAASPAEGVVWLDGDTGLTPHTLTAAARAAGAVVLGVDLVLEGKAKAAFCAVRPPGHHAERHRAMGFCVYSNVAVGAYHAINAHGIERVAVVDFDVHHGNGTEHVVSGDERVLFCSTFQHPFYPYSGHDSTGANVVNATLDAGASGKQFRAAVETHWLPRLEAFAPQLILVSAGFDAHQADDMSSVNLVDRDYAWVTQRICEQADASARGRIVSALEGGYELHALARSVEAHLKAMLGESVW